MVKPVGAICNIDCTYCYYLHKEKLLGSKSKCQITDEILETHIRQCGGVLNAGTMTISSSTTSSNFAFLTCSRDVATRPAGASTMATRRVEPETPTAERKPVRWCPLIAVLSLLATVVLVMLSIPDIINRMGNLTVWSAGVFLCTLIFPIASLASFVAVWRADKNNVRRSVRRYSIVVAAALLIATAYLAYWGMIGLRPWA